MIEHMKDIMNKRTRTGKHCDEYREATCKEGDQFTVHLGDCKVKVGASYGG